MYASTFLNTLKANSLQNVSSDFFDDDNRVVIINGCLDFIYHYLNRKDTWYYSKKEQTITPDAATDTFELSFPCYGIIKKLDWDSTTDYTGVWGNAVTQLSYKHFFTTDQTEQYTFEATTEWVKYIKTAKEFTSLKVRYKRGPARVTVDSLNTDIDLPEDLVFVLLNLCLRRTMPVGLEQGAALAKFYIEQVSEELQNYAASLWHEIDAWFMPG